MTDQVTLTLPYPVSANRYWRTYMPKGFAAPVTTMSKEAKAFKESIGWRAKAAGVRAPIKGRVALEIFLFPNRPQDAKRRIAKDPHGWDDTVLCIDLDNALKVLIDAIKGVVIEDDKWVRRIVAERMVPDGDARVVLRVTPIETQRPPEQLVIEAARILVARSTGNIDDPMAEAPVARAIA